jgi:hypothetical protein
MGIRGVGMKDKERTIAWEKISMNTKASRVRVNKKISIKGMIKKCRKIMMSYPITYTPGL